MSIASAAKIMQENFYQDLPGTLLEGLGKLLATNVRIYVEPMARESFLAAAGDIAGAATILQPGKGLIGLDDLALLPPARQLLEYLRASGRIVELERA